MLTLHALLHHIPAAVHDLLHHEDKTLVKAGLPHLRPATPEESGALGIEKAPGEALHAAHNAGLLLHDYLHALPGVVPTAPEAEQLLKHWEEILLSQPGRLAGGTPNLAPLSGERARTFWRERLEALKGDKHVDPHLLAALEEWERLSGAHPPLHPVASGQWQAKQWQDLIIRQRLHKQTEARSREW